MFSLTNEWQVWSGSQDEGGLPDLEHGAHPRAPLTSADLRAGRDQHGAKAAIRREDVVDERSVARLEDVQRQLGVREEHRGEREHRHGRLFARHSVRLRVCHRGLTRR